MAGFKENTKLNNEQSSSALPLVIANSETIYVGGAVKISGGYVAAATAGAKVLGICVGIVDKNGLPLDNVTSGVEYDGTWTSGGIGVGNYVAASDNQTDKQVKALVVTSKDVTWVNKSAAALTQAMVFGFFNLTSATQIATYVGDVAGAFQLVELDPEGTGDSTIGSFRIAESQLDAYSQS